MFDETRLATTESDVNNLISILDLKADQDRILDMGCGPGRHLLELSRRGFTNSTGIDSSQYFLDIAQKTAKESNLNVAFVRADMREYFEADSYTVVTSLFSSLGYFESHTDNMQVLRNAFQSLKKDGQLLVDVRSKENFAYNFDRRSWTQIGDSFVLTKREYLDNFSKIQNNWTVIERGRKKDYAFTHWIYSAQELIAMLQETGFHDVKAYGGLDSSAFKPESKRLIVVGYKP